MHPQFTRRQFIHRSALTAAGAFFVSKRNFAVDSPSGKLRIGVIGVANRAGENLKAVASEDIVALCDVDQNFLAAARQQFPNAKTYSDWRKMFDAEKLDAAVISTTDHTHAVATVAALKKGLHVYCEKPLTHTISEARIVARTARETGLVTQMGTQIHAGENYRRVVELVKTGAIGPVREVHHWVGSVWTGHNRERVNAPAPPHLDWDLWLGPAAERPYSPAYVPAAWRGFWAFGGGAMADMACHHMDLSFWALDLGSPTSIEADGPAVHPEFAAEWLVVRYEFPGRGTQPPVTVTWHNGGKRPKQFAEGLLPKWGDGTLFIGDKGMLLADYGKHLLLPEKDFAGFKRPDPFIPASVGHHREWIDAAKTKKPNTTCNFDYGARLTEAALLGNVAFRTGKKILWDGASGKALNAPEADKFIQHHYRSGWSI
ncbi:MAG TPA: Gfo/Idh/MocA family oxidoreductase [Methylomirabilota bacterium]|nr:Gfo/Idh/MocA family oxidoreductase [Methylomirabilota bacterium]